MAAKCAFFLIYVLLIFLTPLIHAAAQDSVRLTIFRDAESLTIYVPATNQPTSVSGLAFQVQTAEGEVVVRQLDRDYAGFLGLTFDNLPTPICLRLVLDGSQAIIPQACQGIFLATQRLVAADVFWNDISIHQERLVTISQNGATLAICPPEQAQCNVDIAAPSSATQPVGLTSTPSDVQPVSIIVSYDLDSLTLLVPGNERVSLEGLRLEVVRDGQVISYGIEEYQAFQILLPFSAVQAPVCLHLKRRDSTLGLSQACQSSRFVVAELEVVDVFWLDNLRSATLPIRFRGPQSETVCSLPDVNCPVIYLPPGYVPPPTNTPPPITGVPPVPPTVPPTSSQLQVNELTQTNICVPAGSTISVRASGSIRVGPFVGVVDPEGTERGFMGATLGDSYDLVRSLPHGALMCRVTGEQDWRLCAANLTFQSPLDGCLEFQINDNDQGNNSGAFDVRVEVS